VVLVDEHHGSMLDSFTLAHLSRVIAGEANRRVEAALAAAHQCSHLLKDALDGNFSIGRLKQDAEEPGLPVEELTVAVTNSDEGRRLGEGLSLFGLAHSSTERKGYFVSLLPSKCCKMWSGFATFLASELEHPKARGRQLAE